ncbi:hypothetical protein KR038_006372 [Drosophila bunnanda]|nr:hypothetical protein KR038_006372 [Drosophila bunnanda]
MRFLLLCSAALLLLAAPAKTKPSESSTTTVPTPAAEGESTSSSPPPAETTPSASTELIVETTEKPAQPIASEELDPKLVKKLRQQIAEAQAELKALNEENKILEDTIRSSETKFIALVTQREGLARELSKVRHKLREAQDKLNTEEPLDGKCKPTDSELAKQIEEETRRQLDERKVEIKRAYERKYEQLLKELRLKIRRELELLNDSPK